MEWSFLVKVQFRNNIHVKMKHVQHFVCVFQCIRNKTLHFFLTEKNFQVATDWYNLAVEIVFTQAHRVYYKLLYSTTDRSALCVEKAFTIQFPMRSICSKWRSERKNIVELLSISLAFFFVCAEALKALHFTEVHFKSGISKSHNKLEQICQSPCARPAVSYKMS